MSSINDYHRPDQVRFKKRPRRLQLPFGRLARQILAAVIFFVLVAAGIGAQNWLGAGARYVVGTGLRADNSWLDFSDALPVFAGKDAVVTDAAVAAAGAEVSGTVADSAAGNSAANGSAVDTADRQPLSFIAPASGVVVKDMALDSTGITSQKGIMIQGAAGQEIMAAAAGEVLYLGECDSGYIVQLQHDSGYISSYQGISKLTVAAGDQVQAGDSLGVSDSGELFFALSCNDVEVDPLEYLFGQNE